MCDYSLELYRSKPADIGESLTLTRFGTGSMGFTPNIATADCAACVPEGATLRLEGIHPELQEHLGVKGIEDVVMTRMDGGLHKDSVTFHNGRIISLQSLNPGLTATMLTQPALLETPKVGVAAITGSRDDGELGGGSAPAIRQLEDA